MRVYLKKTLILLAAAGVFTACSKETSQKSPFAPAPEVTAARDITKSFVADNTADRMLDGNVLGVRILKTALDKEFLLRAQQISQLGAPQFGGLKSRVVSFSVKAGKVYLLEATAGHVVTDALPAHLILTSFPTEETEDSFLIDFNAGMSKLFIAGDWRAQDFESGLDEFKSVPASESYLESVETTPANELYIRQIAQFSPSALGGNSGAHNGVPIVTNTQLAEIRYYLSPYAPNPNFESTQSLGYDRFGFFEVAPFMIPSGGQVINASKFHLENPIVFAVSSNTPIEFRQAVKEGVLYWNQALGSEKIQVVDAPVGLSAPHPQFNIVQWVDWDNAGFAYADAQMDPRTGEILNAQVYFTSAFAFGSKRRARTLLRKLKAGEGADSRRGLGLKGFGFAKMCDRDLQQKFVADMEAVLTDSEVDDAQVLRISQDYIREVVAHEIGHTLGLRHNFAGNLASNYHAHERDELLQQYLDDGAVDSHIVPTSSVMDYSAFYEAVAIGDIITKGLRALPYDLAAIKNLYLGEEFAIEEIPTYCTDSHVSHFADCNRFDFGNSVAEYVKVDAINGVNGLPLTVVEAFVRGKTRGFGLPPQSVNQVRFNPTALAASILGDRMNLYHLLQQNTGVVQVHRRFHVVDGTNYEEVQEIEFGELRTNIGNLGGINAVAFMPEDTLVEQWTEQLDTLLDSGEYDHGIGTAETEFAFTDAEKAIIRTRARKVFERTYEEIVKLHVKQVDEGLKDLPDLPLTKDMADALLQQSKEIVLSHSDEVLVLTLPKKVEEGVEESEDADAVTTEETVEVEVPVYRYSLALRIQAASFLKSSRAKSLIWGRRQRSEFKQAFVDDTKDRMEPVDVEKIDLAELDDEAALWLVEQKKVKGAVDAL